MLVCIKFAYVDIDEFYITVLKSGLGGCGKVAVPCADSNDHIGSIAEYICTFGSGGTGGT